MTELRPRLLNADDPASTEGRRSLELRITWYSMSSPCSLKKPLSIATMMGTWPNQVTDPANPSDSARAPAAHRSSVAAHPNSLIILPMLAPIFGALSRPAFGRAGVRAAMFGPFPRFVHIHALCAQHLAMVLGIVLWAIAKKLPVRIERLDARVGGIAVHHQAARIRMA